MTAESRRIELEGILLRHLEGASDAARELGIVAPDTDTLDALASLVVRELERERREGSRLRNEQRVALLILRLEELARTQ